jgi:hypothetical protein
VVVKGSLYKPLRGYPETVLAKNADVFNSWRISL